MRNAYDIVDEFEKAVAEWAGSKYAVAVESGTAALFLSCVYKKVKEVTIPSHTYPSVPMSIIHAGGTVNFENVEWRGIYELRPYNIYDGALRFRRGMYSGGLHCLSFHTKKLLPIGRGGMILTDSEEAHSWLKKARFDGRDPVPLSEQEEYTILGYNMYLTPEQALRGLELLQVAGDGFKDLDSTKQGYPNLEVYDVFKATSR